ncbi:protein associated with UVRAG as autophagy enhancer-like [Sphaeramia orbicularis]|uniref:protein associated with UVRAG as autophagy enhancer-like n=1 Tax=Sphaeramia orbicularis TaxID=375764 RepID=UPI00117EC537|nr:protein associated with UVRAG as autophagy enhancer-like [Sphaeramia orbicularis]
MWTKSRKTNSSTIRSGKHRKCGEHKGWTHTGSNNTSGFSFSTQRCQDRRSSGIPEFPADIFKSSCELEKENAHFVVVDLVLEVLEGVKSTKSFNRWFSNMNRKANNKERCGKTPWSSEDTLRWKGGGAEKHKTRVRGGDFRTTHRKTHSSEGSGKQLHIQDEEKRKEEEEEWEPGTNEAEHQPKTFSVLSNDSGFEDYADSNLLTHRQAPISAEWLAQQLVLEFKRNWFPSRQLRRDRLSLRSSLQELPGTGGVVCTGSLTEEIRQRTRMRGTLSWTPPRFQIICSVQPTHRRSAVVALQQFLCAGCGTEVEP